MQESLCLNALGGIQNGESKMLQRRAGHVSQARREKRCNVA
jgi:hypothetical protein